MRQLRVLVQGLPSESSWQRVMRGHQWQDTEYLLAIIADRLGESAAAIVRAQGGKAKAPKPIPRPDDTTNKWGRRGTASVADVKAYLDSKSPTAA